MYGSKSHQNRRIFRGKVRDGHIPSKSIMCKKKIKAETNKYDVTDNRVRVSVSVHPDLPDNESSEMLIIEHMQIKESVDTKMETDPEESEGPKMSDYEISVLNEIKHVRKRIKNIQESIQLSPTMADPNIWKVNCLNAVFNCVNEWRNIVAYHGEGRHNQLNDDRNSIECGHSTAIVDKSSEFDYSKRSNGRHSIDLLNKMEDNDSPSRTDVDFCMNPQNEWSKETSRQIYGLIQMALQTGPLKASNPGYFKRCGSLVASMAKEFLEGCIDKNIEEQLRFTARQSEVLNKWLKDSSKAVDANKEPSKYALKLQTEGMKKSKKGKKK